MTPDKAMDRAAAVLTKAEEQAAFDARAAEALVVVADGWRRLGQALHQQTTDPAPPRPANRPSPASMPPRARR
jgi:hypothetical protein